uniref:Uncharacterized protein n=1 Tax=Globisporangium ultimum (strain ATCC 200006 / CBS 805.95 / DAOM BR144) TaxID=431595 RepID=K3WW76_GLOUD
MIESLHAACRVGDVETVHNYNAQDWEGTPLCVASARGHYEVARILVAAGTYVTVEDDDKWLSPLLIASSDGHFEIVCELVKARAQVNATDAHGRTPLWMASSCGDLETVRALAARGANIGLAYSHHQTPLAVAFIKDHVEVARELVSKGERINTNNPDCVPTLAFRNGPTIDYQNEDGQTML